MNNQDKRQKRFFAVWILVILVMIAGLFFEGPISKAVRGDAKNVLPIYAQASSITEYDE